MLEMQRRPLYLFINHWEDKIYVNTQTSTFRGRCPLIFLKLLPVDFMLTDVIPCLFTETIIIAGFWREMGSAPPFWVLSFFPPQYFHFFIFKTTCHSIYNADCSVFLFCRNIQIHYAQQTPAGWLVLIKVKTQLDTDKYIYFFIPPAFLSVGNSGH